MTEKQMEHACVTAFAFFVFSIPVLAGTGLYLYHIRAMASLAAGCPA